MEVRKVSRGRISAIVFQLPVRIEGDVGKEIRYQLASHVNEGELFFVYDLSHTHYIDSAGLGALVSKIATIRERGGDVVIIHPTEFVKELLQVTNLNQVFHECQNLDCALAYFAKKQKSISRAS